MRCDRISTCRFARQHETGTLSSSLDSHNQRCTIACIEKWVEIGDGLTLLAWNHVPIVLCVYLKYARGEWGEKSSVMLNAEIFKAVQYMGVGCKEMLYIWDLYKQRSVLLG